MIHSCLFYPLVGFLDISLFLKLAVVQAVQGLLCHDGTSLFFLRLRYSLSTLSPEAIFLMYLLILSVASWIVSLMLSSPRPTYLLLHSRYLIFLSMTPLWGFRLMQNSTADFGISRTLLMASRFIFHSHIFVLRLLYCFFICLSI